MLCPSCSPHFSLFSFGQSSKFEEIAQAPFTVIASTESCLLTKAQRLCLNDFLESYPQIYRRIVVPKELKWEVRDKLD
jgi:hypothetical protein